MSREPLTEQRIRARLKPGQFFRHELTGIAIKRIDKATWRDLSDLTIAFANERKARRPRQRLWRKLADTIECLALEKI